MKKYRLKKEAVQFFEEKTATKILSLFEWELRQVDINALEEVQPVYLTYGVPFSENVTTTSGWNKDKGSHFHFTINFPSSDYKRHDEFTNGRMVRELMDKIQNELDYFNEKFSSIEND